MQEVETKRRGDYFQSVTVQEKRDVEVLNTEKAWEILEYAHESPEGVRPEQVAEHFDLKVNQAFDKLKLLYTQDYLKRIKRRGKPGGEQERKKILYLPSSIWGWQTINYDFEELLNEKYGKFVMEKVRPMLLEFFSQVLQDMCKDNELNPWFPMGEQDYCPDCGIKHQAVELFRALSTFATQVVEDSSFKFYQTLLDRGYITKKAFDENTAKTKDQSDWVLSDRPSPKNR